MSIFRTTIYRMNRPAGSGNDRNARSGELTRLGGMRSRLAAGQARCTPEEQLFDSLMEQYHYLRYEQPVGEHLKYLVKADGARMTHRKQRHLGAREEAVDGDEQYDGQQANGRFGHRLRNYSSGNSNRIVRQSSTEVTQLRYVCGRTPEFSWERALCFLGGRSVSRAANPGASMPISGKPRPKLVSVPGLDTPGLTGYH